MSPCSVTVRYLEMRQPRRRRLVSFRPAGLELRRIQPCPVPLYRELYAVVGGPNGWTERNLFSDAQLAELLARPSTELFALYRDQAMLGFFELDTVAPHETEFLHVGLFPEHRARGAGPYLVQAAFDRAWLRPIERVYGRTSSIDHPAALPLYQLLGAVVYREEEVAIDLPRG